MFGLNPANKVLTLADTVLTARIASAKGDKKAAVEILRQALVLEDALAYDEPPAWILPVRGNARRRVIAAGSLPPQSKSFATIFSANRRNGRSLFGLWESLKSAAEE